MPERPKGVDSKSTVPLLAPGVRIPLSPPHLSLTKPMTEPHFAGTPFCTMNRTGILGEAFP